MTSRFDSPSPDDAQACTLQNLTFPDPEICTSVPLFAAFNERAVLEMKGRRITFLPKGEAIFDRYFNILNLGTWTRACRLDGLWLRLAGAGRFALEIWRVPELGERDVLYQELVTLEEAGTDIDLGHVVGSGAPMHGVIGFRLVAFGEEGRLTGGVWITRAPETPAPSFGIAITTFRREADVEKTARRLSAFIENDPAGAGMRVFVIDNGRSLDLPALPGVEAIPNANLGGAGGFARGLTAVRDAGLSHCLFMDDDASFQMESLVRARAFHWLARSERAALAGAMISAARPWAIWENGAVFEGACQPQHVGTDLRDPVATLAMELEAAHPKPAQFYGGWWFFAFPVAALRHWPFPFFVRGDDISFSLANRFDFATLPGVVSFQEDFSVKESPLTLYLDIRNHLSHHLSLPHMERGATATAKIPLRFILRNLVRFHYESCEAMLMAWEDVMKGPDFFARNADMSAVRPRVLALRDREAWRPVDATTLPAPVEDAPPGDNLRGWLWRAALNGHLLPFGRRFMEDSTVPLGLRGLLWPVWGAKRITYLNAMRDQGYTVEMDRRRGFDILRHAARMAWRWRRAYPRLMHAYTGAYGDLAAESYWQGQFEAPQETGAQDATPISGPDTCAEGGTVSDFKSGHDSPTTGREAKV